MSLAITLTIIIYDITRYGLSVIYGLGIVGSILNIILFSRRQLRQISCCIYFLAASCANLIALSCGIIPSLYTLNNIYPGSYSIIFCKMQGYLTHTSLQMIRIFIVLACFDRYALSSSNNKIRKFSQINIAYRSIPIVIISCYLIGIHLIIYLDVQKNACSIYNLSATIYNSIYSIITISIVIPILMLVFSLLTFYNLKQRQRQRRHLQQQPLNQEEKRDRKVFIILMMQLILYFISTAIYGPNILYSTITQNISNKSFDQIVIETFISHIAVGFIYFYPGLSFFAFTLASKTFRKELIKLIYSLFSYHHQRTTVVPLTMTTNKI